MDKNKRRFDIIMDWKTIAVIFIILFLVETSFIAYGIVLNNQEVRQLKECYYDICSEYPNAELSEGVCFCYDYGVLGDWVLAKSEVMK